MYKDLPAIRGKYYIQRLIEEGEHEHQDFKYKISDACKIARSISAFSNNDGGRLLVGVKDNGVIAGIRSEEDVHVIEAAAEIYCRPAVRVEMTAFQCEGGLVVLRASIPRAEARPVECREEDGSWRAYYRVADENIAAHPLMVRTWRREYVEAADGLAFSADEGALLQSLESLGPVDVEQMILHTHLSRRSAEDMIVKLAGMGLVEFVYSHQRFMVITNA